MLVIAAAAWQWASRPAPPAKTAEATSEPTLKSDTAQPDPEIEAVGNEEGAPEQAGDARGEHDLDVHAGVVGAERVQDRELGDQVAECRHEFDEDPHRGRMRSWRWVR